MKVTFASTLFCECNGALEHVEDYVRCVNATCPQAGKKWQKPAFMLEPYEAVSDGGTPPETPPETP